MLGSDIDFAQLDRSSFDYDTSTQDGKLTLRKANSGKNVPGMTGTAYFRGLLDGRGYTFKNLIVDMRPEVGIDKGCGANTECNYVGGLVGRFEPNQSSPKKFIKRITVETDVYGGKAVGGVSGDCYLTCLMDDVHHSGIVESNDTTSSGVTGIGGLVGYFQTSTITNSSNAGSVNANGKVYAGGLVGYSYDMDNATSGNKLAFCSNSATVTSTSSSVGGIIGEVSANMSSAAAYITEVYNKGSVTGTTSVGGIAGRLWNYATLRNAYNVGAVRATTATTGQAGGIIGYFGTSLTTSNLYNAGIIRAPKPGGVVGGTNASTNSTKGFYLTGTTDTNNDGVINGSDSNWDSYTSVVYSSVQMKAAANFWSFGECLVTAQTTSTNCTNAGKTWDTYDRRCKDTAYTTQSDCQNASLNWDAIWNISEGSSYPYLERATQSPAPGS